MKENKNTHLVGARYEELAADYLTKKGYNIIKRNYRNRWGEIDIIARDESTIVFVEVKYRSNNNHGNPLEAVTPAKQHKICRTALNFLTYNGYNEDNMCRFDVVAIYGKDMNYKIEYIKNAFDYCF